MMSPAEMAVDVQPDTAALPVCALDSVGLLPPPTIDAPDRFTSITQLPDALAARYQFVMVPRKEL